MGVSIGGGLIRLGGGFGSSGDTSMTGGEGLGAIMISPFPWVSLGPRSEDILFLSGREVGMDIGVDNTAGVEVSDTSCCGCLVPGTDDFSFTVDATGSGV